jgi:hypothetical protein
MTHQAFQNHWNAFFIKRKKGLSFINSPLRRNLDAKERLVELHETVLLDKDFPDYTGIFRKYGFRIAMSVNKADRLAD